MPRRASFSVPQVRALVLGANLGLSLIPLVLLILFTGCTQRPEPAAKPAANELERYQPVPYVKIIHPDWSKNASIYQINTRQFTPEGTLRAAESEIPRLKELGVTLLWLMPIHPVGQKNRKGTLGSPYAVRDYLKVNPELGTLDDLKHFVSATHQQGMYVILTGLPTTRRGTISSLPSIPSGTRATGRATSVPRPGSTGAISSISTTLIPSCAST